MVVPLLALVIVVAIAAVIARLVLAPKAPPVPSAVPANNDFGASGPSSLGTPASAPVSTPPMAAPLSAIDFELPPAAAQDPEFSNYRRPTPAPQAAVRDAFAPPAAAPGPSRSFLEAPEAPAPLFGAPPSRPRTLEAPVSSRNLEAPLSLPQSPRVDPALDFAAASRPRDPAHPVVTNAESRSSILELPTPIAPSVSPIDPNATARVQAVVPASAYPSFDDPRNDPSDDDESYSGGIPDEFIAKLCDHGADDEPVEGLPQFVVTASANTDRGRRRKRNEDSVNLMQDFTCFAVADGMGGHRGGAEASAMATETLETLFREQGRSLAGSVPEIPRRAATVALGIAKGNHAIYTRAQADPTLAKMGTTMVVAHFVPELGRLYLGHVGDSRCYRLRKGHLERLTQDHTMAEFGLTGPMSANLSRAVGIAPTVKVDVICGRPEAGDVYLLCSDGLTKMLEDALIHDALDSFGSTPEYAVDELVALANARGGRDNVTVVVAYVGAP